MQDIDTENKWKETVRDIFDKLMTANTFTEREREILTLIETNHSYYFCEGKTMAEWEAIALAAPIKISN